MRAQKLQKRAARVGFDWPEVEPVLAKVHEEIEELQAARQAGDQQGVDEELGDLLFAVVNLARHLGTDAEEALRASNRKFERRFRGVEARVREQQREPGECTLAELDAVWEEVKRTEQ